jgi:hypothetical protein
MNQEEKKDWAAIVARVIFRCAKDLKKSYEDVTMKEFLEWLIEDTQNEGELIKNDEGKNT